MSEDGALFPVLCFGVVLNLLGIFLVIVFVLCDWCCDKSSVAVGKLVSLMLSVQRSRASAACRRMTIQCWLMTVLDSLRSRRLARSRDCRYPPSSPSALHVSLISSCCSYDRNHGRAHYNNNLPTTSFCDWLVDMTSAILYPEYGITCHYLSVLYTVWTSSSPALKPIYLLGLNVFRLPSSNCPHLRFESCIINICMYSTQHSAYSRLQQMAQKMQWKWRKWTMI